MTAIFLAGFETVVCQRKEQEVRRRRRMGETEEKEERRREGQEEWVHRGRGIPSPPTPQELYFNFVVQRFVTSFSF